MPVIKSAKKKLRQDKKRTEKNSAQKELFRRLVKKAKKNPSEKSIHDAVQATDKAAKKHIVHKNKAARIKSSLNKLLKPKEKKILTTKKSSTKKVKPAQ